MKHTILAVGILLAALTGTTMVAQKADEPAPKPSNRSFDGTPLDPFKEGARIRAKEQAQKNYQEMKEAADELLLLSEKLNQEVTSGGENVISARIFDHAEKIEKLARRIREKAKAAY